VCKSKEEQRAKKEKVDNKQMKKKVLKASEILRAKYWKDQQRGCLEHCANHPLYARHMVPFFAEIPTGTYYCTKRLEHHSKSGKRLEGNVIEMANSCILDWETATASIVAPSSDSTLVEDLSKIKTPVTPASGLNLDTKTMNEPETGTDLSKIKTPVTPASGINLDTKSMNEPETGTDHNMVLFVSLHHQDPVKFWTMSYLPDALPPLGNKWRSFGSQI
jgi:hypothetical protein